jgi:multiple sugar transport system permease protein
LKKKDMRLFFLLPAIILLAIFVLYPAINTFYNSLVTSSGSINPISNYRDVLSRREIINVKGITKDFDFPFGALMHNLLWIIIHLPITTFLGLILAVILRDVKGNAIIKSVIFLGMVIPMVIGGLIVRFMFDKYVGIIPSFLNIFGVVSKSWTTYPDTALFSIILGSIWLWTGFSMVLYSAGLSTIPKDYYDAAKVDGASSIRIFFSITLPMLKPITTVIVTMTILWELKIFDIVYVATMGGPGGASNVLALQMYLYAFRQYNFTRAAVVATILMLITMIVAIPMIRSSKGEERA